jgi:predicted ATP-grasp superfamily ATP-dependent carboligase
MKNLYAILLGGKIRRDNLMEDHQLVFVVASEEKEARRIAKQKWPEAESIHVDGTQCLKQIDGYTIELKKTISDTDQLLTDNQYSE